MQRKLAYGMLALAAWAALVVAIHFAETSGFNLLSNGWHLFVSVTLVALFVGLYFLPGVLASRRSAKHTTGIVLLNLLLGWTLLGWVAALIWAVSDETSAEAQPDYHRLASMRTTSAPPPPHA